MSRLDKTKYDKDRSLVNLHRSEVTKVLPEHFVEEYPKLIEMFDAYYEYMDSDTNPDGYIHNLYKTRDATQVPESLLTFLEDELLLGQAYFGGFQNKREAVKYSNLLYRSKGTKYSIEQFFRAFFGIDVGVTFPKDQIFRVGPAIDEELDTDNDDGGQVKIEASKIGPESRKYITDDKLYQIYSVLIRAGLSVKEWQDVYKLFVHPAGMYLGSELLLEIVNEDGIDTIQQDAGELIPETLAVSATAAFNITGLIQETYIGEGDSASSWADGIRMDLDTQYYEAGDRTFGNITDIGSIAELISPNSLSMDDSAGTTFDEDSDSGMSLKSSFDQHKYSTLYDSDGSGV